MKANPSKFGDILFSGWIVMLVSSAGHPDTYRVKRNRFPDPRADARLVSAVGPGPWPLPLSSTEKDERCAT
jgi:hypothetical protein